MVKNTQNQGQQIQTDDLLKMIGLLYVQNQALREGLQVTNAQFAQFQERYKSKEKKLGDAINRIKELEKR